MRLLAAAAVLGSAASLAAACGFPDVRFGVVPDDDVDGAAPEAAGPELDGAADVQQNADAPGDEVEAGVRQDGQARIDADAPCPGANPCDCDNDGYEGKAEGCAGDDCDDRDPVIHPNQGYISEPPEPPNEGNWDCTDPIEKQYVYNLNCGALGGTGEGFRDDPACGAVADYYECTGFLFGSRKIGTRRQGCK